MRQECDGCPWLDPTMDLDTEDNLVAILIEAADAALSEMAGRSPHVVSGRKGKPKGAKAQWAMHDFVLRLWEVSRPYGGVTLSSCGGEAGGTIVAMLHLLKPMLPKQFFPGILNYSFLRKIQKSLPPDPYKDVRVYLD